MNNLELIAEELAMMHLRIDETKAFVGMHSDFFAASSIATVLGDYQKNRVRLSVFSQMGCKCTPEWTEACKQFIRAAGGKWERKNEGDRFDYTGKIGAFEICLFFAEALPTPEPLDLGGVS
jgi:hypothetical protein